MSNPFATLHGQEGTHPSNSHQSGDGERPAGQRRLLSLKVLLAFQHVAAYLNIWDLQSFAEP